jgi:hypothetical protein
MFCLDAVYNLNKFSMETTWNEKASHVKPVVPTFETPGIYGTKKQYTISQIIRQNLKSHHRENFHLPYYSIICG